MAARTNWRLTREHISIGPDIDVNGFYNMLQQIDVHDSVKKLFPVLTINLSKPVSLSSFWHKEV